jgi:hypothetical protein
METFKEDTHVLPQPHLQEIQESVNALTNVETFKEETYVLPQEQDPLPQP